MDMQMEVINYWKPEQCHRINKDFHGYEQATNISMETGEYKSGHADKNKGVHKTVVKEFSVQLWSVNQQTIETEEVTDS
jgi:hypothetical protein